MIEEDKNKIIDKLTNEGQLLRNTGKNSIRSVNIRLDKFSSVFSSIDNSLMLQSVILQESLNLSNEEMEMKRREALLAQEDAEKRKRKEDLGGNDTPDNEPDVKPDTKTLRGKMEEAFRSMFGFVGGAAANAAFNVARLGALLAVAPAIGEFIGDFVKAALTDFIDGDGLPLTEAQKDFVEKFSNSLTEGATWGILGLAFGKKFAATLFAVTALADYFNLDEAAEKFLTELGMDPTFAEATVKIALGVASGIIMLAVPFIIKRTLAGVSLALASYAWPALKGAGAAIMAGASSLLSTVSSAVAGFIDDALKAMGSLSKYLKFAGGPLLGAIIGILTPSELGDGTLDDEIRGIQEDPNLSQEEKNKKIGELLKEREKRFTATQLREEIASRPIDAFNTRDYPYAYNYSRPETMVTGGLTTNGVVMGGSDQERAQDRMKNTVLPILEEMERRDSIASGTSFDSVANKAEKDLKRIVEFSVVDKSLPDYSISDNTQILIESLKIFSDVTKELKDAQLKFVDQNFKDQQSSNSIVFAPNISPISLTTGGSSVNSVNTYSTGYSSLDHHIPKSAN